MLWGLGSLALPILAHMVHRHTSKRLDFPSLRFIRISEIPRKGKNIPTDLLLLLLRLLLLTALVLFLAGPKFIDPDQPPVLKDRRLALVPIADDGRQRLRHDQD